MQIKTFIYPLTEDRFNRDTTPSHINSIEYSDYDDGDINIFLQQYKIISVSRNVVITREHNNGGYSTTMLVTTILFEEN